MLKLKFLFDKSLKDEASAYELSLSLFSMSVLVLWSALGGHVDCEVLRVIFRELHRDVKAIASESLDLAPGIHVALVKVIPTKFQFFIVKQ